MKQSTTERARPVVLTDGGALAVDLFDQRVRLSPGLFAERKGPPCAYGTYVYPYANIMRPARCRSRSCAYCRRIESWRITRQIQNERITTYSVVPVTLWPVFRKRMRQHPTPYKGIPQHGDPVFYVVFSREGDRPLPIEDALVAFVDKCLENTLGLPTKKDKRGRLRCAYRFRTTHGFGAENDGDDYWVGSRAKARGRRACHYVREDPAVLVARLTAKNEREARYLKTQDDDGAHHLSTGQIRWLLEQEGLS